MTGLVVLFLLLMHQLPTLSIGGTELRHVNLLSQILPDIYEKDVEVVPAPKAPKPVVAVVSHGRKVAFKEVWPKDVEPILDFSGGRRGGMDHFYAQLAHVKTLDRPVRIAYFGDSFIEGDILTGDLRALFQNRFGGAGVGWVDCGTPMTAFRRTVNQHYSGIAEHSVVKKPFETARQALPNVITCLPKVPASRRKAPGCSPMSPVGRAPSSFCAPPRPSTFGSWRATLFPATTLLTLRRRFR